jgi:hypothetical protein
MVSKRLSVRALDEDTLRQMEDDWLRDRYLGAGALMHDDYMGGRSSGARLVRDEFLDEMDRPIDPHVTVSHDDRRLRQFGATVVSTGVTELATAARSHRYRYLRVFHLAGQSLTLVASQSTVVR